MKIEDMGLTKPCPHCNGEKMATRFDTITGEPRKVFCPDCGATGVVPSNEGIDLLRFIKKYIDRVGVV